MEETSMSRFSFGSDIKWESSVIYSEISCLKCSSLTALAVSLENLLNCSIYRLAFSFTLKTSTVWLKLVIAFGTIRICFFIRTCVFVTTNMVLMASVVVFGIDCTRDAEWPMECIRDDVKNSSFGAIHSSGWMVYVSFLLDYLFEFGGKSTEHFGNYGQRVRMH